MLTSDRKARSRFGGLTVYLLRLPGMVPIAIAALALALLAFACAPAEEPTATPSLAPAPAAATPTATSAPAVAAPTATSALGVVAQPTATPIYVVRERVAEPTPVSVRPEMTAELIERLPQMTADELMAVFPSVYPREYEYEDIKLGGIFTAAMTWDFSRFDARMTTAGGTMTPCNIVYERLVHWEMGPERETAVAPEIVPDMAESWEYNEDATKLTFKLVQGMYWGDMDDPFQKGPEVVAEDIKYVLEEYRDNSVYTGVFRALESVDTPDRYTVVLNFDGPNLYLLPFLASKDAAIFNPHLAKAGRMDRELVGPGPFIVTEMTKSVDMKFARNPNYFMKDPLGRQYPYLDGLHLLIVPDMSTRVALLRTQRVDHAASVGTTMRDYVPLLRTNPDLQVFTYPYTSSGPTASFQLNNPIFQDVNVRRALALAADTKGITDVIYGILGAPGDGKFDWPYYTDTRPTWESDLDALFGPYTHHYDPEKARELWAKGGLGEISLNMPYYRYREAYAIAPAMLADNWAEVLGINLSVVSQDYTNYNSSLQAANYPEMIYSWGYPDYSRFDTALNQLHSQGGGNRENINDPIVDQWVDTLVSTLDPAKQKEAIAQMRARVHDQVYFVATAAQAVGFHNVAQPWVRGLRGGENNTLQYYYMGSKARYIWLDK